MDLPITYRERPAFGFGMLAIPFVLILSGAGATLFQESSPLFWLGFPAVACPALLLAPLAYVRRTVVGCEEIVVSRELLFLRDEARHSTTDFTEVRWAQQRPKPVDAGSSHSAVPTFSLIGKHATLRLPLGNHRPEQARELANALGLTMTQLHDGRVVP